MRRRSAVSLVLGMLAAGMASAEDRTSPVLGAATNFGQGWQPDMLEASGQLPVTLYRDAVYWSLVERDGAYVYDVARAVFPDLLAERGARLVFVVNNGHPDYDDRNTPLSAEAVAAFAAYAAEAVRRFPAIESVEVGNEMNAGNFVSGPGWEVPLEERAVSYTRLLEATAAAVRAVRPEVEILGGAGHSISLTWFEALSRAGAPAHMDAVSTHPYTVPAEMMTRKFAELRKVPGFEDMPLVVTEIGRPDPAEAPGYMLRTFCQLALVGTSRYVWYPLNPRGDGMVPLVTGTGEITAAGRAYRLVQDAFAGEPVTAIAPDPFTHGCRFGAGHAVLWGAARPLEVAEGVVVRDATGAGLPRDGLALSPSEPVVLSVEGRGLEPGRDWRLGPQQVIADSYHQFGFDQEAVLEGGGWARWIRTADGTEAPMEKRPGQRRGGVPWDPHLGTGLDGVAMADADWMVASLPSAGPLEVLLRHRVAEDVRAVIEVEADPRSWREDGPALRIARGDTVLEEAVVESARVWRVGPLDLRRGEVIEVATGPNGTGSGNFLRLRARLLHAGDAGTDGGTSAE